MYHISHCLQNHSKLGLAIVNYFLIVNLVSLVQIGLKIIGIEKIYYRHNRQGCGRLSEIQIRIQIDSADQDDISNLS